MCLDLRNYVKVIFRSIFVMNLNLRDVQYFAIVAEHRHLGRAADALGLSQPALSMSLRRLEQNLGTKLVRRTPKGVDLTAAGTAIFNHARRLRLFVEDISGEVADLVHGRVGHLRVATSPGAAHNVLPTAFSVLVRDAPKVTSKVVIAGRGDALTSLRKGELDLVIAEVRTGDDQDLVQEGLFDDEFIVYASAKHRLANRKRVALSDLVEERWALSTSDTPLWLRIHHAFQQNGLSSPRIAIETASLGLRLPLVASSDLLGYSSRAALRQGAPQIRFAELHVKELAYTRRTGMLYRKDAYLSPVTRNFVAILKETARAIYKIR